MLQQQSEAQPDDAGGLYITDTQLYRMLGLPPEKARLAVKYLEQKGFPRKQEIFGNRRYRPAVRAYLDNMNGVRVDGQQEGRRHGYRRAAAEN